MGKFVRTQIRIALDQIRRLKKLQDRTGVDRSNHIRIAIARYLDEEELRHLAMKARIENEAAIDSPKA
jgi:predicted DNA-binding protein